MHSDELFDKANALYGEGNYVEALDVYQTLVASYPRSEHATKARERIAYLRAFEGDDPGVESRATRARQREKSKQGREQQESREARPRQSAEADAPPADGDGGQARDSGGAERTKTNGMSTQFPCVRCGVVVRIRLPPPSLTFRCAKCGHSYKIQIVAETPLAVLLIPEVIRESAGSRPPPIRTYPPAVLGAFTLLGTEPTDDMTQIRVAYRKTISQYHPDKVAHLGPEFGRLAHEKTKAIVEALAVLRAFIES